MENRIFKLQTRKFARYARNFLVERYSEAVEEPKDLLCESGRQKNEFTAPSRHAHSCAGRKNVCCDRETNRQRVLV